MSQSDLIASPSETLNIPAPAPAPLTKALVAAGFLAPLALPLGAEAATITVQTTAASSGALCTLQDAARSINTASAVGACAAGSGSEPNIVQFAPGVVGDISIAAAQVGAPIPSAVFFNPVTPLTINGPGAANLSVSCAAPGMLGMLVMPNTSTEVAISGLTVKDCSFYTEAAGGVTVLGASGNALSQVSLTDVVVQGNAGAVGGLFAYGQRVTLERVVASNNTGSYYGGGFAQGMETTVTNSAFVNNSLANVSSSMSVSGLMIQGSNTAELRNSTISGNTGNAVAAIAVYSSTPLIDHATIVRNSSSATADMVTGLALLSGGSGSGGEVSAPDERLKAASTASVRNSIICANTGSDSVSTANLVADYNLLGTQNLIEGGSLFGTGNVMGCTTAQLAGWLGPLADNGGPTPNHALLNVAGNPAIGGGDPEYVGPVTDQRGQARVAGGRTDIGAYELVSQAAQTSVPVPATGAAALGGMAVALAALGMRRRRKEGDSNR